MIAVTKRELIGAPVAEVWKTIRDFNGLTKFVSLIASSSVEGTGVGAVRTLKFTDGQEAVETLEEFDEATMTVCYSLVDEPSRPFRDYSATMRLRPYGDRECEIEWFGTFEPQGGASEMEARQGPETLYADGIAGLKRLHGESAAG
jgi:hypothetical protein